MNARESEELTPQYFAKARLRAVFFGLVTMLACLFVVFIMDGTSSSLLFMPMGVIISVFLGCLAFLLSSFFSIR